MAKPDWRGEALRPIIPMVTRLDPVRYNGARWVVDGRNSERYANSRPRLFVHWFLALLGF